MFRRSYLFLFVALVLTGLLILYRYLGGFNEPLITWLAHEKYVISGNYYEGNLKAREWEDLFNRTADRARQDPDRGVLTIVWYNEPGQEKDVASAFIGLKVDDPADVSDDMETRVFCMKGVVRATLESHVLVMPDPQKIRDRIKLFARENGYDLQDILIEIYPEESVIYAEIPVKD